MKLRVARCFYMLTIMGLIGFILEFGTLSKACLFLAWQQLKFLDTRSLVSSRNNVWGTPRDSAILMTCHYKDLGRASDWSCHWGNLLQPIRGCYSGTPPYDHPVNTTTPLLRPLFCGPNKSPLISLSENPVNPTTPLLRPTTTFGSPESLFSL